LGCDIILENDKQSLLMACANHCALLVMLRPRKPCS